MTIHAGLLHQGTLLQKIGEQHEHWNQVVLLLLLTQLLSMLKSIVTVTKICFF